jgi:putative membrane protein
MKKFLVLGKVLAAIFWGVVLANLLQPFAQPFALLLQLAGALLLLIHGLELWAFNKRLGACQNPAQERVQILLFGIFHLHGLSAAQPVLLAQEQDDLPLETGNA